uniref:UBX domain-containing protein n=1 Tax=Chlamydomonas leiostraca TaxID=1034604 RepID=A0A7S0NBM9_9CHLO
MLEAADWNVETAVGLFFASGPDEPAGGSRQSGAQHAPMEDDVRAPMPTKVERLYGDHMPSDRMPMSMGVPLQYGMRGVQRAAPPVDVFKDKEEASSSGLSSLFKAPAFCFHGGFEMAKAYAMEEGKWLLLNIQHPHEFSSHRLNRDTWSHEALGEMVRGNFVFYQTDDSTEEGRKLQASYRLGGLPVILVIDPLTGAKLFDRSGFVEPDRLIDILLPFLEHGPKDPGAHQIAHTMSLKRKAPAPAGAGGSASARALTEDEELARAIAMSMEQDAAGASGKPAGSSGSGYASDNDDDDIDEAAIWEAIRKQEQEAAAAASKPKPEEVMAAAAARLPAEPGSSDAGACRVAIRWPSGERTQRSFLKTDTVQALHDLVLSKLQDAAEGKAFTIAAAMPGAQPLTDVGATLEAAGVANAMVQVRFS